MNRHLHIIILLACLNGICPASFGQKTLPEITVKGHSGRVIVSWLNDYKKTVTNISIQRSFDSSRHFITIGSVLNPMNLENGFMDESPPYDRMYYRVFISFEGGTYSYSQVSRPDRHSGQNLSAAIQYAWQIPNVPEIPVKDIPQEKTREKPVAPVMPAIEINHAPKKDSIKPAPVIKDEETYPSQRVFTSKENNVVINLQDASNRKYSLSFFDESGKEMIHIGQIREKYLILEKVNFTRSGWYYFDLFEGPIRIERSKVFIPKDGKNGESPKSGRN